MTRPPSHTSSWTVLCFLVFASASQTLHVTQAVRGWNHTKLSHDWRRTTLLVKDSIGLVYIQSFAKESTRETTACTDIPGTDIPGTDIPGTDTPGTDTPGNDTPGTDTPGIEQQRP